MEDGKKAFIILLTLLVLISSCTAYFAKEEFACARLLEDKVINHTLNIINVHGDEDICCYKGDIYTPGICVYTRDFK